MATQEGTCGPDCQVIILEADDVNDQGVKFPDTIHGIIHAPKCVDKDYYGDAFLDAVYHGEVPGAPEKIVKIAHDMTAHILIAEIVRSARNGHDYRPLIEELRPLVKDSPKVQTLLRDLIQNLEAA